ncbi:ComEC/Rec2 family competence protein [Chryseobacterium gwangjuense]|uniref:ComEC/Rec2 family competence protein n=1 Tax=Chryseobacterium gwangjuense TaxID=1069980 RepID=UPI001E4E5473|nr:ComEC/Rec2 family competence protein [Chryseobacterium gwangjuense]
MIGIGVVISMLTYFKTFLLYQLKPYLLGLMFFGIGVVLHSFNSFENKDLKISSNEYLVFKISKKLNSNEKNKKYEGIAQIGIDNCKVILYVPRDKMELDFNHYYKAKAYISKPESPQNDFQFDYSEYLKRKKIEYQCYINGDISFAIRDDLNVGEKILQKRLEVLQNIDKTEMSSKSKEFLKGVILADRTEIDAETLQDFNKSGLVHFLAISGTHIAVIFGLFYMLLVKILPVQFRKYAIIASLLFIWMFAVFIGLGNSVVRSCIMLTVYFVYVLLQRKPDLLHSLALSAFIILIFDSEQLFDIGFQLSFIAVLGIFWLNQPILHYLPNADTYFKKLIFNTVSISISAQLVTLPLVLFYFHQFSLISIVANFFIVPFSETIIVFSFLMTVLIVINLDVSFINIIYDFTVHILHQIIHWFASVDILFSENIAMNLVEVICLFAGIYLLRFMILKFNTQNAARLIMCMLVFLIIRTGFNLYQDNKEEVLIHNFYKHKVLSVKKGDRVSFWIDEKSDKQKIIRFIVNPYCSSRRLHFVTIKTLPSTVQKMVYDNRIYMIK